MALRGVGASAPASFDHFRTALSAERSTSSGRPEATDADTAAFSIFRATGRTPRTSNRRRMSVSRNARRGCAWGISPEYSGMTAITGSISVSGATITQAPLGNGTSYHRSSPSAAQPATAAPASPAASKEGFSRAHASATARAISDVTAAAIADKDAQSQTATQMIRRNHIPHPPFPSYADLSPRLD